jgi:uncharacterized protein with gpF-like domain
MIWQDYRKLYMNALVQYSPKFKKELQKQVDTYCRTQDFNAISDKGLEKTIKQLHVALGTKMALIAEKDVKKGTKGAYVPMETKSAQTDLFSYVLIRYLETKGLAQLSGNITDTTKEQIRKFLIQGQKEGLTMPEIIALLKTTGITNYRAELIARTETARAANLGSMIGALSTGLVTNKEWIAAKDARTRRMPRDANDHYHMDGVQVAMDQMFVVPAKEYIDNMLHPGDPLAHAGNVCNCRCTLGYEAVRGPDGKLKRLADNPPMGDIGLLWELLTNLAAYEIGQLLADALT